MDNQKYQTIDIKTDVVLLTCLISILLPDSNKNQWTPIQRILKAGGFCDGNFTQQDVINLLTNPIVASLFAWYGEGDKLTIRIAESNFYSNEEKANSSYRTRPELYSQMVYQNPNLTE
jgi:hypothetical protein